MYASKFYRLSAVLILIVTLSFPMLFIQKPQSATNLLLSSFRYRSIDSWNSLPLHIKNSFSLSSFKKALHNIDFASFLYGSTFTALSDFKTIF